MPDDVAATLTPDDVRRILDFQVEYFKRKGVSANGSTAYPSGTVVIGGAETVEYILERCAATGEAYLPEQVYGVVDTQLTYLRTIGAIGPAVGPDLPRDAGAARMRRPPAAGVCGTNVVPGKGGGPYMHDQRGTLEVRGR